VYFLARHRFGQIVSDQDFVADVGKELFDKFDIGPPPISSSGSCVDCLAFAMISFR
jgi:hypothetical protein